MLISATFSKPETVVQHYFFDQSLCLIGSIFCKFLTKIYVLNGSTILWFLLLHLRTELCEKSVSNGSTIIKKLTFVFSLLCGSRKFNLMFFGLTWTVLSPLFLAN